MKRKRSLFLLRRNELKLNCKDFTSYWNKVSWNASSHLIFYTDNKKGPVRYKNCYWSRIRMWNRGSPLFTCNLFLQFYCIALAEFLFENLQQERQCFCGRTPIATLLKDSIKCVQLGVHAVKFKRTMYFFLMKG